VTHSGEENIQVKRIIFGVGDSGKNTILFHGAPRVMVGGDEELQVSSEPPSEKIYMGWAASALDSSTSDYAAQIQNLNFKLNPGESRFLRVEIAPGAESPMHRTPNITDYLVAVSGELTMYAEDGMSVRFAAGDMLVQLGGWHWYKNEGAEPFVMAGVVVGVETDEDVPFGVERRAKNDELI
jgi:quercetin dioxygenase-like cupin family protein